MTQYEVKYRGYREYIESRVTINNSMMAILAGTKLAAFTLSRSKGSDLTLKKLYPEVRHIGKFNLNADNAIKILADAEEHLAAVALTYALATHENFVIQSLDMLRAEGIAVTLDGSVVENRKVTAKSMHNILFQSSMCSAPNEWLLCFSLMREVRNCIAHNGGRVGNQVNDAFTAMSPNAKGEWERITGAPMADLIQAGRIVVGAGHISLAFAITKRLGREINKALVSIIPRNAWAQIAVEDYDQSTKTSRRPRNSDQWFRGLAGYVRFNYGPLKLNDSELHSAAASKGF